MLYMIIADHDILWLMKPDFWKKMWWLEFGPKEPKLGPKLGFLPFSQVWFISFSWNSINGSLQQCLISSRRKTHKKFLRPKFGSNEPKSGPRLVFCHFLKVGSLVFLEIPYNDSFQPCLISSTDKTCKKKKKKHLRPKCGPNGLKSGSKLSFLLFSQVCFISFPGNCIGW